LGPLHFFFNRFSLTPRNLQFFADFTILAIFANIEVLVGAFSIPSSTIFAIFALIVALIGAL